ncbi:MAG: hypothetical protein HN524_02370, partial [Verrucomicrobia bacterium]|nr:hypothetical protein [Verrucomicrobiota bacterium]
LQRAEQKPHHAVEAKRTQDLQPLFAEGEQHPQTRPIVHLATGDTFNAKLGHP